MRSTKKFETNPPERSFKIGFETSLRRIWLEFFLSAYHFFYDKKITLYFENVRYGHCGHGHGGHRHGGHGHGGHGHGGHEHGGDGHRHCGLVHYIPFGIE